MIGDIYSEKLFLCCLLNAAATGVGMFCMFIWIGFFQKLALDTDSRLQMGTSSLLLLGGWGGSAVTALLYGRDWLCNTEHIVVVHKDGKEHSRKNHDGTDVHKRDKKGASSGESSSGEEEIIITRGKKKKKKGKGSGKKKKKEAETESDTDTDGGG